MTSAETGPSPASGAAPVRSVLAVPDRLTISTAAALAAAVLAMTSTGSIVVVALLVGIATLDRRSGTAVALVAVAVSIRFGTTTLGDLAGVQSVLGPAVSVGPELAAASAWCAGGAVLLATRVPPVAGADRWPWRLAVPLATGLLAAAVVAGPGPDDVLLRVGASVAGVALALASTLLDRRPVVVARPWLAVVLAGAACVLAGWPT